MILIYRLKERRDVLKVDMLIDFLTDQEDFEECVVIVDTMNIIVPTIDGEEDESPFTEDVGSNTYIPEIHNGGKEMVRLQVCVDCRKVRRMRELGKSWSRWFVYKLPEEIKNTTYQVRCPNCATERERRRTD